MNVEIINKSKHPAPKYATPQSAGVDLHANLEASIEVKPLERTLVPTGVFMALESGTEAQIRPRSGFAYKQGMTVLNSPGTIDADYRGELKVLLVNLGAEPFEVRHGERIAQLVLAPVALLEPLEVEELPAAERGDGGFGSTGR